MNYRQWPFRGEVKSSSLTKAHKQTWAAHSESRFSRYLSAFQSLKSLHKKHSSHTNLSIIDGVVTLRSQKDWSEADQKILRDAIKGMMPWRKGPFDLFGELVDAEWRSDLKWQRVKKFVGPLQGKVILDVGCNNGYYFYPILKQNPKFVLGIDPVVPYYFQHQLVSGFLPEPKLDYKLVGVKDLTAFKNCFDVVFCMGIVYHHPDPIGLLKILFDTLRPGGQLIVESLGIPGDDPYCLLPESRYLGMPGHWFIPTAKALMALLRRSGFQYVELMESITLTDEEQRQSIHSPHVSLNEGLTPDKKLTKEGYLPPMRFYVRARRARKPR